MAEKEKAKDECRNKWVRNRLGLIGRTEKALNYDTYFMKKNSSREEYLNDLRKKVTENYKSPDLILAIEEVMSGEICLPCYSGNYSALVLAHTDHYEMPHKPLYCLGFIAEPRADKYFSSFYRLIDWMMNTIGQLNTLSKCGRHKDHFIWKIPGKF